jgi:hypothetical protein
LSVPLDTALRKSYPALAFSKHDISELLSRGGRAMPGRKWLLGLAVLVLSMASGCRLCDRYCEREWDDRHHRNRNYGGRNDCCPPPQCCPPGGYSNYQYGAPAFAPPPAYGGYNDCCR